MAEFYVCPECRTLVSPREGMLIGQRCFGCDGPLTLVSSAYTTADLEEMYEKYTKQDEGDPYV